MADSHCATKLCIRCRETKTLDCFTKHKQKKDGLSPYCRDCLRVLDKATRERYKLEGRYLNPITPTEKFCHKCSTTKPASDFYPKKESKDGLRHNCKECGKSETRSWVGENKEHHYAVCKAYTENNKDKKKAYYAAYHLKHREKKLAYARVHYANNKESRFAQTKKWVEANRERRREIVLACQHRRRAQKLNSEGSYKPSEIRDLHKKQKGKCAICREKLKRSYHRDHIVPLSRGGSNHIHNIQLLCRTCNLRKNAKDPIDFMQSEGYLL